MDSELRDLWEQLRRGQISRREFGVTTLSTSFRDAPFWAQAGIHNHDRRVWIPGSRPRGRATE